MRIDRRFWPLLFCTFALTGCNGTFLSRTTPISAWTESSTQSRQRPIVANPFDRAKITFTDIYDFGGSGDGSSPFAGVIADKKGNVYGTTLLGGSNNDGAVWRISPNQHGAGFTETLLYSFDGGTSDGAQPYGDVTIAVSEPGAPPKKLVGMTSAGGSTGLGTAFQILLNGKKTTESILYSFAGGTDGASPHGGLLPDKSEDFYGLTSGGGSEGFGTAFKLTKSGSVYTESVIYTFTGGNDGGNPYAGLIADTSGVLYGTTAVGGTSTNCTGGCGTIFELTPTKSGYAESVLYSFQGGLSGPDGANPFTNLTIDNKGNLYGTTLFGGSAGLGTVFKLSRSGAAFSLQRNGNVSYTESILHSFAGSGDGSHPESCVVMDKKGNLYGTTHDGGASNLGIVFMVTQTETESVVHSFQGGATDGANPVGGLVLAPSGSFGGTTTAGGKFDGGTLYLYNKRVNSWPSSDPLFC